MQVFAKRFWGFDVATWPIVSFGKDGDRDALVRGSMPGDLMAFIGTQDEPTPEDCRGKLIGIGQFTHDILFSRQMLEADVYAQSARETGGTFKWPYALPMVRAWEFTQRPRPGLVDTIGRQLPFKATIRAVRLSPAEQEQILSLAVSEVAVPDLEVLRRQRAKLDMLIAGRPTTGPVPSSWSKFVDHNAATASFAYVLRFGNTSTWKIGHTTDLKARLAEVNSHVPHETIGHGWIVAFQQRYSSQLHAYKMEQRLLSVLTAERTVGERVRCSAARIQDAWLEQALKG